MSPSRYRSGTFWIFVGLAASGDARPVTDPSCIIRPTCSAETDAHRIPTDTID